MHTDVFTTRSTVLLRDACAKAAYSFRLGGHSLLIVESKYIFMFVVVFAQNTQAGLMGLGWCRRAGSQPVVISWIFPEEMRALGPRG